MVNSGEQAFADQYAWSAEWLEPMTLYRMLTATAAIQNGPLHRWRCAENNGFRGVFCHGGGFFRRNLIYFLPTPRAPTGRSMAALLGNARPFWDGERSRSRNET